QNTGAAALITQDWRGDVRSESRRSKGRRVEIQTGWDILHGIADDVDACSDVGRSCVIRRRSVYVRAAGIEGRAALDGDDAGQRPMIDKRTQELRVETLAQVRNLVAVIELEVVTAIEGLTAVVPRFVVGYDRIESGCPHRPRPGIGQAEREP